MPRIVIADRYGGVYSEERVTSVAIDHVDVEGIEVVFGRRASPVPATGSSVVDALLTVLTDRGHDAATIAERVGRIDHDGFWDRWGGPAADALEELLGLPANPTE
jgi:hypothetical protein